MEEEPRRCPHCKKWVTIKVNLMIDDLEKGE